MVFWVRDKPVIRVNFPKWIVGVHLNTLAGDLHRRTFCYRADIGERGRTFKFGSVYVDRDCDQRILRDNNDLTGPSDSPTANTGTPTSAPTF